MGVIDEDGRPIRGAGALPWTGGSGGVGDISGVTFSRNIFEKPPSQVKKGNFMADWDRMIADIRSNEAPPLETNEEAGPLPPRNRPMTREEALATVPPVYPPGTSDESRAIYGGSGESPEQKRIRRLAAKEAIRLRRVERAKLMRVAKKAKQEALRNGGTGAVSEPALSEHGGGPKKAGQVEVRGDDEGHGVSSNGLPDLSQPGGDVPASGPRTGAQGQVPAEGLQPQLRAIPPEVQDQLRQAVIIAAQPFHVNPQMFASMPMEQAEHLLNELRAQAAAISQLIEERRQNEVPDRSDICTICLKPFPGGIFFARFPFELEAGSNQWRAVYSCRDRNCLAKFQELTEKIQAQLKAERNV